MHSPWGWNPATLWAVGIAVLAVAAVIVVARDGIDRRAARRKFAHLVNVEVDTSDPAAVALSLTNLGDQPIFLRSVLLWIDLQVQARDLLSDRSLVTTRWPWLIGRVQVRCEVRSGETGPEVPAQGRRRLAVTLQRPVYLDRVVLSGVAFVDSEGRTFTRRPDGRVLRGERISRRLLSSAIGDPLT